MSTGLLLIRKLSNAVTHIKTDRYGVKKPIARQIDISKAMAKIKGAEDTPKRFATLMRKIAATETLKSNKAKPGPPRGNIENSRCTPRV